MKLERPSLEALVESGELEIEILHPGGLKITEELADLCRIGEGTYVLDVASGTGEGACFLAEKYGCKVVGIDASEAMVRRAGIKAREKGLNVEFRVADAHRLPFEDNTFDVVISECTLSLLDKERAMREMVRVTKPGGCVGIHDVFWQEDAPEEVKKKLEEIEGEKPETLSGWVNLFKNAGLVEVVCIDKSSLLKKWMEDTKKKLGILGQVKIFIKLLRRFGIRGCMCVIESEKIFESGYLGYAVVVGRKP